MSVMAALSGHAVHAFTKLVRDAMEKQGLSVAKFCELTAGSRDNSGTFYLILNGKRPLSGSVAEKWGKVLNIAPESLLEANAPLRRLQSEQPLRRSSTTSVHYVPTAENTERVEEPSSRPPFSLVVNPGGATVTVRLEVNNLPLARALRLLEVIGLSDLVNTTNEPRRIEHTSVKGRISPKET